MKLFIDEDLKTFSTFKFKGIYSFPTQFVCRPLLSSASSQSDDKTSLKDSIDSQHESGRSGFKRSVVEPIPPFKTSMEFSDINFEAHLSAPINPASIASAFPIQKKFANSAKKSLSLKTNNYSKQKKGTYNTGRWTEDEHRRFIEAIMKFGNEWKSVQAHIKTRSSAQSRSHSQKFFLKVKNYDFLDFKSTNPSITSLNELARTLSEKERNEVLQLLISCEYNELPQPKPQLQRKRKSSSFEIQKDFNEAGIYKVERPTPKKCTKPIKDLPDQGKWCINAAGLNIQVQTNADLSIKQKTEAVDDFHSNFFVAFSNPRLRRISFEENLQTVHFHLDQNQKQGQFDSLAPCKDFISENNKPWENGCIEYSI